MQIPTIVQVEKASHIQLARWHRFCSSPETEVESQAMNRNYERLFNEMEGFTPEISKLIGWDQK